MLFVNFDGYFLLFQEADAQNQALVNFEKPT